MDNRAKLSRALRNRTMVRIVRSLKHAVAIDGLIVAVGESWGVIQGTREGGYFDGYSAFRLKDIKKVRVCTNDFANQFSRTLPTWPPHCPKALQLDSSVSVVRSMAASSGLIGIEREGRLSAIWIGRLKGVGPQWTRLFEVGPDGSWDEEPSGYKTKQITLVSIETMYQRALAVVAGTSSQDI